MLLRAAFLASLAAALALGAPSPFVHPGVFLGAKQLAFARARARAGDEPFASALAKALASPLGSVAYAPQGPPANHVIECGSYSKPNLGCSAEDSDGAAAYLGLVLFAITDDARHAAVATRILRAYAALEKYNNSNAPLQAAWGLSKWSRAAELALHLPGTGWTAGDAEAFAAMLARAAVPLVENGSGSNGNWEASMIEGLMGFAVLTENAELFDRAVSFWRERVPANFYNFALDGKKPRPAPRGDPSWYGQVVFSAATSGVAQETCRDLGHTTYSVAATSNAAETALLQGVDLWAAEEERLATAFDFNAHLMLAGVKSPADLCGGTAVKVAEYPSFEVALAALSGRRNASIPNVLAHVLASVRTNKDPVDSHMMVYETLTHGGAAPALAAASVAAGAGASAASAALPARGRSSNRRGGVGAQHDTCCTLCGGIAVYPVGSPGTSFFSTQTVPGLPLNASAWEVATYYIYFNIFFDNDAVGGRGVYNQFVPQLMLGPSLTGSTGPPDYNATWSTPSTWIFGAQYFFALNGSDGQGDTFRPKAATGPTFPTVEGEVLFTRFSLSEGFAGPQWLLEMGVVGDPERLSSVVVPSPYMGLLAPATQSWSEAQYDHVNSCWELYNVDTPHAFPSTGSDVQWTTTTRAPNSIDWFRNWSNIEVPTCAGAPTAVFSDAVSPTWQRVDWTITGAPPSRSPPASPPAGLCDGVVGTDYVCCDLAHSTGVADPGACCALCEATAGCTAWKYDTADAQKTCYLKQGELSNPAHCPSCVVGQGAPPPPPPPPAPRHAVFSCGGDGAGAAASLVVFNDSSYSASVGGVAGGGAWFEEGDVAVFSGGKFYSLAAGTLALVSMGPAANGSDNLGAFSSFPVSLAAAASFNAAAGAGPRVELLFACYAQGLVAFNLSLPDGLPSTAGSGSLVSHFPSFKSAGAPLGEELGWLLNGGIWTLFEFFGVGAAHGYNGGDGPAWFFNTSFSPSTIAPFGSPAAPATAILCALDHFKSMVVAAVDNVPYAGSRISWGLMGSVAAVPAGFATSVGLFAGAGVSATTYEWGAIMTKAYSTQRLPLARDVLNGKLSFWSDNGAVYFQSYWDDVCKRNCTAGVNDAETLFAALKAYHVKMKLPYALYQLDTWWFYQQADVQKNGDLDCVDWRPREDLWPNGLLPVTQRDIPLLLYAWGWVRVGEGQRMLNYTWMDGPNDEAIVTLNETLSFYRMIRDRFITFNGTSFEQDNMGSVGGYEAVNSDPTGGETWWRGFATPWCESGIPVQICEATASDLLESLRYACVTSTRDQIDDVPGTHQDHGPNQDLFLVRWHVGFDRMLIGALGLLPFFDNVWSQSEMPGPPWGGLAENYTELAAALSVLGGGAVGFSDELGFENRTLIMACAMEDGTLLSPSRPSHYLDMMYLPPAAQPFPVAVGRVLQAPTFLRGSPHAITTVLAIDVPSHFFLLPQFLTPDLSAPLPGVLYYLALRWAPGFDAVNRSCFDSALSGCAQRFDARNGVDLFTGTPPQNYTHFHEIVSISPLFASGFALLGELGKFVRVSAARFAALQPTSDGMTFEVFGAQGEQLSVAIAALGIARRVDVSFEVGGWLSVACAGPGERPCQVTAR